MAGDPEEGGVSDDPDRIPIAEYETDGRRMWRKRTEAEIRRASIRRPPRRTSKRPDRKRKPCGCGD